LFPGGFEQVGRSGRRKLPVDRGVTEGAGRRKPPAVEGVGRAVEAGRKKPPAAGGFEWAVAVDMQ